MQINYNDQYI